MRELAPGLPTALLLDLLPPGLRRGRLPFGARIAGPGIRLVTARPAGAARCRRPATGSTSWTVNEPDEVDLAIELGSTASSPTVPRSSSTTSGR